MAAIKTASVPSRAILALALVSLLALRLMSPPGFMPAFANGAVTIIVCPDAEPASGLGDHNHHGSHSKVVHQTCAYASASTFGAAPADAPVLAAPFAAAATSLIARPFAFAGQHRDHERPPPRGPPISD
jgi:hypothetical protein